MWSLIKKAWCTSAITMHPCFNRIDFVVNSLCRTFLHWVISWNVDFTKMSTLFCFGCQGCWQQDSNAWLYFQYIRYFFIAEMGKAFSRSWAKQRTYCTAKTFSCSKWTAMWFASARKMASQTKKPYFNPWII